ncbi:MAG: glycosyltransferase family 2 protein [Patescibacteria group bacterium]
MEIPKHTTEIFFPKRTKYCVVIPTINEGKRIQSELQEMKSLSSRIDIIITDGGSTDSSLSKKFLKSMNVRVLLTKRASGFLGTQLRIAYLFAVHEGYQGIITIDGNNKDGTSAIPLFIDMLDEGYDYVQGSRFITGGREENTPLSRYIGNRFIHAPLVSLASLKWYTDTTNGFRGYSIRYLLDKRVQPFRSIFTKYELLFYLSIRANQIGYSSIEVPVSRVYPKGTVPTKISALRGNLDVLVALFKAALGFYNP